MVAIGNALVDVLSAADDDHLKHLGAGQGDDGPGRRGAGRGDLRVARSDHRGLGGSAANTMAGVAALGGRAAFLGRVADDQLGRAFTHDIRSIGVALDPSPVAAAPGAGPDDEGVTGHCLVLVTSDAERTMATHLGVASDFGTVDLDGRPRGRVGPEPPLQTCRHKPRPCPPHIDHPSPSGEQHQPGPKSPSSRSSTTCRGPRTTSLDAEPVLP